jgi:hypothetical protein
MDQHPALMVMSAQQRTRDIAADVATLGQASTPATRRGLLGFFTALLRGPRPAVTVRVARSATKLPAPSS